LRMSNEQESADFFSKLHPRGATLRLRRSTAV
jgi:hypothetical protein